MRKLRIAYLSSGTFWHAGAYLRFFSSRGHDVHWITYTRHEKTFGVQHYTALETRADRKRFEKWRYFIAVPNIRRFLREIRPDILHGHYVTSSGVLCLLSGFRPYVLSARGTDTIDAMNSALWRATLRYVFKKAAGVNPVSEQLAELVQQLGVKRQKILTVPQGIVIQSLNYKPNYDFSSPIRIICTRFLSNKYDPITIVNACEILTRRRLPFTLTFAAGGPLQMELERMVLAKGLDQQIEFVGGYSEQDLPGVLHKHHIYVSAAFWDGTPNSLLEAMATGLFPVVSRTKANKCWVREGETALMFECGNAEELAEKIVCAVSDSGFCHQAIEVNRSVVEERADREKNLLQVERWYYQILQQLRYV